ncbi:MAG: RNase H family protein [Cyclobacteriaceae bacterium]
MSTPVIEIFTDGSCHSKLCVGAWAAFIVSNDGEKTLTGTETDTTHNRMELLAVIKSIQHAAQQNPEARMIIYSDSQYVCHLPSRFERLKQKNFLTNRGTEIQNVDLVNELIFLLDKYTIEFIKVKAHQKSETPSSKNNRYVDKLSRKVVREQVNSK